jgi:hypothetical protein
MNKTKPHLFYNFLGKIFLLFIFTISPSSSSQSNSNSLQLVPIEKREPIKSRLYLASQDTLNLVVLGNTTNHTES